MPEEGDDLASVKSNISKAQDDLINEVSGSPGILNILSARVVASSKLFAIYSLSRGLLLVIGKESESLNFARCKALGSLNI